ncbi:DnaJ domain-containing protein [Pararhizobium sp. BT-229]|uniref:DnaJ C-terminal domain-containing protein n=1 Tax=Pararhizobium sp. BT-229 TaxID=2986923 RepID=UPI0021F73247|nr:DnaJ C-terminal domain-containing protein [Pararhizobium sp. BT-229]MCV9964511.1 DnaJ domain-containing protein [Pararhizobium sp. BT-229]
MSLRDHRKTLGVSQDATPDEIKSAYRKLAKQYHPDTNSGDPEAARKFREVTEAYKSLNDNASSKSGGMSGGSAFDDDLGDFANSEIFNHIFDVMFKRGYGAADDFSGMDPGFFSRRQGPSSQGGGKRSGAPVRGDDREREVEVTLEEAFSGADKVIETDSGDKIRVKVPSGVLHGAKVRVRGHGGKGRDGGADGDLFLVLTVLEHERFQLDGQNLRTRFDVPFTLAAIGGTIEYVHLDGQKHAIDVQPFRKGETTLVAKGRGWPERPNSPAGHLLIDLKAVLPETLSERQRKLLEEFEDTAPSYRSDLLAKVAR